nr:hypothetical protein [Tanacetum cinerariifolium]
MLKGFRKSLFNPYKPFSLTGRILLWLHTERRRQLICLYQALETNMVKETPDEPSPAKRSKGGLVGKIRKPRSPLKLVDEPSAEDVPVEEPAYNEEEANLQQALD